MVTHRYVGVVLGLLMLLWFASGIVMLFVRWPEVTLAERAAHLAPLDWSRCCRVETALGAGAAVDSARVEMMAGGPVLRLVSDGDRRIVDLTTGVEIARISEPQARAVAATYVGAAPSRLAPVIRDQWTVTGYFDKARPFWRAEFADGRQVYVSQQTGEVVQDTTRTGRVLAWLGPIPHWLYPTVLRKDVKLWTQVVIWTSVAGLLLTVTGIYLGIVALWRRPGRITPYRGVMSWHHVVGLVTGLLTLTWTLSGLLSMNPWGLLESGPDAAAQRLTGKPPTLGQLEAGLTALQAQGVPGRRVEAAPFQGRLFLVVDGRRFDAAGRPAPLSRDTLATAGLSLGPVARQGMISDGDAYYFAHHEPVILPVWRVIGTDGVRRYLDPTTGQLLATVDGAAKGFRWWHEGLHRLDVVPANGAWSAAMVVLLGACLIGVGSGVWLAWRRVRQDIWSLRRR